MKRRAFAFVTSALGPCPRLAAGLRRVLRLDLGDGADDPGGSSGGTRFVATASAEYRDAARSPDEPGRRQACRLDDDVDRGTIYDPPEEPALNVAGFARTRRCADQDGADCDRCGASQAIRRRDDHRRAGEFESGNLPCRRPPLVIRSTEWRRQFVVPKVEATKRTRFRRGRNSGPPPRRRHPRIAISTGSGADTMECLLRKVGLGPGRRRERRAARAPSPAPTPPATRPRTSVDEEVRRQRERDELSDSSNGRGRRLSATTRRALVRRRHPRRHEARRRAQRATTTRSSAGASRLTGTALVLHRGGGFEPAAPSRAPSRPAATWKDLRLPGPSSRT